MNNNVTYLDRHTNARRSSCGQCPMFLQCVGKNVSTEIRAALAQLTASFSPVRRGDALYRAGDTFRGIFIVSAGCIKTTLDSLDGDEQILDFVQPGQHFGFDAFAASVHQSNAVAVKAGAVCMYSADALERISTKLPALCTTLLQWGAEQLVKSQRLTLSLAYRGADERLADLLVRLSDYQASCGFNPMSFKLPMQRVEIGRHLALAPETVSRATDRLRRKSIVNITRDNVLITDLPGLRALAMSEPTDQRTMAAR